MLRCSVGEMGSVEKPPDLSLHHGIRCVPEDSAMVVDVLLKKGEKVRFEHVVSASRMNKSNSVLFS